MSKALTDIRDKLDLVKKYLSINRSVQNKLTSNKKALDKIVSRNRHCKGYYADNVLSQSQIDTITILVSVPKAVLRIKSNNEEDALVYYFDGVFLSYKLYDRRNGMRLCLTEESTSALDMDSVFRKIDDINCRVKGKVEKIEFSGYTMFGSCQYWQMFATCVYQPEPAENPKLTAMKAELDKMENNVAELRRQIKELL